MKRWYVGDVMTRDVVSVGTTTGYKEIADLMVFLASERASYITGGMIRIDGGMIRSV